MYIGSNRTIMAIFSWDEVLRVRCPVRINSLPWRTMSATVFPVATAVLPQSYGQARSRLQQIDILRGAIMIIMALDHVRDFFHSAALAFPPENLSRTTPAIFFTRWITHFCAPVFMFTAGLGAFLWMQRGRSRSQLSRFLLTRGLWLIVLELTVARLALYFNFDYSFIALIVIWALGCCMVVLAALIYLPARWLAPLSVAVIAGHNLLDRFSAAQFGSLAPLWNTLHQPGVFPIGNRVVLVAYPLLPWVAVMSGGYCFGQVFLWDSHRRQRLLFRTGIALTLTFVLLRALNVYGNPAPWLHQHSALFTAMSFLNCTKYPPSLLFLLMTLGPALVALGWLEDVRLRDSNPLLVFGRVPLFYYLLHVYMLHGIALLFAYMRYGNGRFLFNPVPTMGRPQEPFPPNYGYGLWVVYLVWVLVVGLSYPACLWFSRLKQRRHDWWLSYL
jgi:uncharacterized membrane protein